MFTNNVSNFNSLLVSGELFFIFSLCATLLKMSFSMSSIAGLSTATFPETDGGSSTPSYNASLIADIPVSIENRENNQYLVYKDGTLVLDSIWPGVEPGTFGSASSIPQITVNSNGRISAVSLNPAFNKSYVNYSFSGNTVPTPYSLSFPFDPLNSSRTFQSSSDWELDSEKIKYLGDTALFKVSYSVTLKLIDSYRIFSAVCNLCTQEETSQVVTNVFRSESVVERNLNDSSNFLNFSKTIHFRMQPNSQLFIQPTIVSDNAFNNTRRVVVESVNILVSLV
jgi:hypothetical protein